MIFLVSGLSSRTSGLKSLELCISNSRHGYLE